MVQDETTSKRNNYISYLRGWAILSIIIIHLIDWSGIDLSQVGHWGKEWLYSSVLFFVALVGSTVYVAYAGRSDFKQVTTKLILRGAELIGIYYAYNLIKLAIFNFQTEPFYWRFSDKHLLDVWHILTLQSFTVPLSIILTLGVYLMISPVFLYIIRRFKYPQISILLILAGILLINYVIPLPSNPVTIFLLAENNIMFPLLLWLAPYLIGIYLAMLGFEKNAGKSFILFTVLAIIAYIPLFAKGSPWYLSWHMFPVELFYIFGSFALMFLLVLLFQVVEKMRSSVVRVGLALLRELGDATLLIYIVQWIVIDLTYWIFPQHKVLIWLTVPILLLVFLGIKLNRLIGHNN